METHSAIPGDEDMRLHDCRHTFASWALALGETLPMIGRLLGHRQKETSTRYAHLSCESVRESAVRIADSIASNIFRFWAKHAGRCISSPT